jgi:hypothetical protein
MFMSKQSNQELYQDKTMGPLQAYLLGLQYHLE